MSLGFNSVVFNILSYIKKTHARFLLEYLNNTSFSSQEIQNPEIVKLGNIYDKKLVDIKNKYWKTTFQSIYNLFSNLNSDWVDSENLAINLKFAIYVIFLVVIFAFVWQRMVRSMRLDIVKALGILNILPTSHLAANPEFIKEISTSSLIN